MQSDPIKLKKKAWESDFFAKQIYELKISEIVSGEAILEALSEVEYDLVECNLDCQLILNVKTLEDIGFRTVDSRITFLTQINLEESKYLFEAPHGYKIRKYRPSDLEDIIQQTHYFLTNNDKFVSRYKNLDYFSDNDAELYFDTWIRYSIDDSDSITMVVEYKEQPVGFFIAKQQTPINGTPLLKGILTSVDLNHRGKQLHLVLQTTIFKEMNYTNFYLDNTTQLSNIAVIKNHITSSRKLKTLSLTLLLK